MRAPAWRVLAMAAVAAGCGVDYAAPEEHGLPALPLSTESRWIVDADGRRFKLAAVNWYGAEEKDFVVSGLDRVSLDSIATAIRKMGFNAVRLPFSNALVQTDPPIAGEHLAANPDLEGRTALEVLDAVIESLAEQGLVVVLDNHMTEADWCCSESDDNGLWYTDAVSEEAWIADWVALAERYRFDRAVVGADLRNEPRRANGRRPVWGGDDPTVDWRGAATRAGNALLAANPDWLIVVEGLDFGTDLTGAAADPIVLDVPGKLVYSAHDYWWHHGTETDPESVFAALEADWGFLLEEGQPYTAPVWVGEFGTCNDDPSCLYDDGGAGQWYQAFREYLLRTDADWAYWALNGTQARGTGRTFGAVETYGVLDADWRREASRHHLGSVQALIPATRGP